MDNISRKCLGFLIFIEVITVLKHLTFNYYVYLMRMTLHLAEEKMTNCMVVIMILITGYASYQYLVVGAYSYDFRDMVSAVVTKLRTAIAIVKMHIYFDSSFEIPVLNKMMFISFFVIVTLILMNTFISVINNAMEAVKNNKVSKARKRLLYDAELNAYFWKSIGSLFRFGRKDKSQRARKQHVYKSAGAYSNL